MFMNAFFWITTLCGEDYALSSAFKAFLSIIFALKKVVITKFQ